MTAAKIAVKLALADVTGCTPVIINISEVRVEGSGWLIS
jgi:hypothetical protein